MLADRDAAADDHQVALERRRQDRLAWPRARRRRSRRRAARRPRARRAPRPSGRSSCGSPPGGGARRAPGARRRWSAPSTRGRTAQSTSERPTEASTPTSAGPSSAPARRTVDPASMSSPARRMSLPASTCAPTSTSSAPPSVSSTRTTASAPSGTIAPVEIAIASPAARARVAGCPARDSSTTSRRAGRSPAPAVSAARTAYPSIAELSNPGTESALVTSSARTRPSAARTPTLSVPSARARSSTSRRASSISSRLNRHFVRRSLIRCETGYVKRPVTVGAVLAGGLSRRMGSPKAIDRARQPPAGRRVVSAVGSAGLDPIVVAKPDSPLPKLDCRVLSEPSEPHHPLTGIVTALGASAGRGRRRDRLRHAAGPVEAAHLARPARGARRGLRGRRPARAPARPLLAARSAISCRNRSTPAPRCATRSPRSIPS